MIEYLLFFRILHSFGRNSSNFNQFIMCIPGVNDTYSNFSASRNMQYSSKSKKRICNETYFIDKLEINDVSWRYPNTDKYVIENVSIVIKKGQSIGLVGSLGEGKTT